ncbi:MAG: hypothetical protein ACRC0G_07310 [Fusobacteriaceae bacterium]
MSFERFKKLMIYQELDDRDTNSDERAARVRRIDNVSKHVGVRPSYNASVTGLRDSILGFDDDVIEKIDCVKDLTSYKGFTGFDAGNKGYVTKGTGVSHNSHVTDFNRNIANRSLRQYKVGTFEDATELIDKVNYLRGAIATFDGRDDGHGRHHDADVAHPQHNFTKGSSCMVELIDLVCNDDVTSYSVGKIVEGLIYRIHDELVPYIYNLALYDKEYPEWLYPAVRCISFVKTINKYTTSFEYECIMRYFKQCYVSQDIHDDNVLNSLYKIVVDPKLAIISRTCPKLNRDQVNEIGDIMGSTTRYSGRIALRDMYFRIFMYLTQINDIEIIELFEYWVHLVGAKLLPSMLTTIAIMHEDDVACIPSDKLEVIGICIKVAVEDLNMKVKFLVLYVNMKNKISREDGYIDLVNLTNYVNLHKFPYTKKMMEAIYNKFPQYRNLYIDKVVG